MICIFSCASLYIFHKMCISLPICFGLSFYYWVVRLFIYKSLFSPHLWPVHPLTSIFEREALFIFYFDEFHSFTIPHHRCCSGERQGRENGWWVTGDRLSPSPFPRGAAALGGDLQRQVLSPREKNDTWPLLGKIHLQTLQTCTL